MPITGLHDPHDSSLGCNRDISIHLVVNDIRDKAETVPLLTQSFPSDHGPIYIRQSNLLNQNSICL